MSEEMAKEDLSCVEPIKTNESNEPERSLNGNEKVKVEDPNLSKEGNMSEYDSAGSYSDRDASPSGYRSEGSVNFEREEGDGQESAPTKKIDDDEDKKNPQYIPKRGTFYEHDDRTGEDLEDEEEVKDDKDSKKKVWQDKKERWSHDRFNDNEQAPKSRAELISTYGYDIRNEDGPPKARRRRRYGRGPNKYTRNWEDVDAYGKPTIIRKPLKKPRSRGSLEDGSDNTEIITEQHDNKQNETPQSTPIQEEQPERTEKDTSKPSKPDVPQEEKPHHQQPFKHRENREPKESREQSKNHHYQSSQQYQEKSYQNNKSSSRVGTGRISKPKREFSDSDYTGFTKSRQFKSTPPPRVHNRGPIERPQNAPSKNVPDLEKDMAKMNLHEGGGYNKTSNTKQHNNVRQGSVPPRLQSEQKGSKRYSSIRQRSLPETNNPPFVQHNTYYGNEYNQQGQTSQPTPSQTNIIPNNTIHPTTAAQLSQMPNPTLTPIPPQVPVTTTPILQGPPQYAPPFPPAPTFLQPGVSPASFIPPQNTPIINYGQPQYQAPFQGYQQQFNTVNQPTELYQPQGGITYYSPQEQQAAQRSVPQKRPKAAIPIVAPPEHRGRGRKPQQQLAEVGQQDPSGEPGLEATIMEGEKFEDAVTAQ
nr:protein CASC3 isoform X1 [Onthophagus taurus]